jgi:S-formylglutathione hydrolase FrmB
MLSRKLVASFYLGVLACVPFTALSAPKFEVTVGGMTKPEVASGRLFLVFSKTNSPEPRLLLGRTGPNCPQAFAKEAVRFGKGQTITLDSSCQGFPVTNLSRLPRGEYFVQAVFDSNQDFRSANSPGNLYSEVMRLQLDPATSGATQLQLTQKIPPEELPPETGRVSFIKIKSQLLSEFNRRPMYLRAGIVLPKGYDADLSRHFPVWIRIGGLNTRYTTVLKLMDGKSDFPATWNASDTPRFILVQLDGAGPFGDPYYINSANSGPYADALLRELLPAVEERFRAIAKPSARVLSGTSTGGWVALALQILYPDYFNGAWAACPDPVDFRALERLNIYAERNAFIDHEGHERPSERNAEGETVLMMRQEVGAERLLARYGRLATSGEQWGEWTAAFSPRGTEGFPMPLWNDATGEINPKVAEEWKKFDLRLVLERNWPILGPKLKGKLHIASGEADQYFLNDAVHLLDEFLKKANPPADAKIVYGPGKGHGWSNLTPKEMLLEMQAAVK